MLVSMRKLVRSSSFGSSVSTKLRFSSPDIHLDKIGAVGLWIEICLLVALVRTSVLIDALITVASAC